MNTNFSLQRIRLLLQADKTEQLQHYIPSISGFIAISITFMVITFLFFNSQEIIQREYMFYRIGLLVYFYGFCQLVNKKVHQSKGPYLTIPASSAEKYTVILTSGILTMLLFCLSFYISLYVVTIFIPDFPIVGKHDIPKIIKIPIPLCAFIASTVLLAYITFRKHALSIIIGVYAFLISVCGLLFVFILRVLGEPFIFETPLFNDINKFLAQYYGIILYFATLVVLYIGYLKLKGKQIR